MGRLAIVVASLMLSAASAHASPGSAGYATGDMGLLMLGGAAGVVVCLLCVSVVRHFRRMRALQVEAPVPISLLVAERLARAVQRRAGVIAAMGVGGVPALVIMGIGSLAILSTIVGCVGLRGFFVARAALQLIERGEAQVTAEAVGPTVIVRSSTDEAQLEVTPRALAAALRHAVPTSIAKRS